MDSQPVRASALRFQTEIKLTVVLAVFFVLSQSLGGDALAGEPRSSRTLKQTGPATTDVLDRSFADAWKQEGVKPARLASDEEFSRRVYLDLVGRIPSVQEARSFLQTRESGKREKLVEYLLEHPDYPKNFATEWTVLLIGRSNQGRMVNRGELTNWLRKQFSSNRPWNEVVYDLVTATGSNKENGAVNYALAHLEFGAVPLTSRTTRLFLGQQLQCTQCHDHPSNDWKQADFWGINAFFKGMKTEDVTAANATGLEAYDHTDLSDVPTEEYVRFDKRNGLVGIAFPRFLDGRKISQGTDVLRRKELGKLIADPGKVELARAFVNRMWAHFMGRGFVNPVDDLGPHNPPSHAEILDLLTQEFQTSGFDVKKLIRRITASRPYQLSSLKGKGSEKEDGLFNRMQLRPMTPEQLFDSLLTATSAHRAGAAGGSGRKRESWMRQFLFTFGNDEGEEATNFQGTIPQALMMMNGELIEDALSGKPGSFLADVLEKARSQGRAPEVFMINQIYLAALSRYPSPRELNQAGRYLASYPDSLRVLQDLFWALLNSNEFILNH